MTLGIDASNLQSGGGGSTHIRELLSKANPSVFGIDRVIVWAGSQAVRVLPQRPWLSLRHQAQLDSSLPARFYWQMSVLPRLVERECDALFVPGGTLLPDIRPYVTMSRNLLPFDPAERSRFGLSPLGLKLKMLKVTQARTMKRASGTIFLTQYAKRQVLQAIGGSIGPAAIIPHGVEDRFRQEPREAMPPEDYSLDRPFKVLYVSTINPYKHQREVIQATAALRSEGIPIALELVGSTYSASYARLVQETISAEDPAGCFISFRGSSPYETLHHLYHSADAFIFASSCEAFANILLEAMASGLPIACSSRGPMPEVLGDGGLYFDPNDTGAIREALRQLYEDARLRATLAGRAYTLARSYSWERCADETFNFIAGVLSPKGSYRKTAS